MARKSATKSAATTKTEIPDVLNLENYLAELSLIKEAELALIRKYAGIVGQSEAEKAAPKKPATKTAEPEDEDDTEGPTREELEKKTVAALRKMVKELDQFEEETVSKATKKELIEVLLGEEADDEDEDEDSEEDESEDSEDTDDEEGDDDDSLREELEAMSLADLKKTARDDYNAENSELKGLDKDAIIELILNAEDDDDSDTDAEEEEEEGSEEDGYTKEDLAELSEAELLEIYKEWELDKPRPVKNKKTYITKLIQGILDAQDEGDEEE